ncbi:NUDIX hydrolase [Cutibacterium avidum]|uniref:NUDIX hydrolase n=1 Tax=Cutibacterium avidum TaxID=33010 RepID=UPI0002CCE149|nr:NUDIX hydrolase [Cutibacterium avidum]AGJ77687.1 NUDIX family hydrolase [Cutibacterium avidum 44067]MCO6630766.1 NUDIX hydrolase [Cutibacterium avidum]MCO6659533.1 NUDIX hydrolase [Cutibacterium avidum]MCO6663965.1 NUDIX hydrolase [Cutibacterium avidum]MCO6670529.1 NUDIX hydrolase [Cutibacterium avidum]
MVDDESDPEDFRIQVEVVGDCGRLLLDDPPYPEGLTRAISLASDDAILGHKVRRLEARVAVDDGEVIHALHRAGYRREGRLRQAGSRGDGWVDEFVYSRLATDEIYTRTGHTGMLDSVLPTKRVISHVLVHDGVGRVLMCETTYKPDWELPGGVVEPVESPHAGAVRECREELGVTIDIPATPVLIDWMPPALGWSDAIEFIYDAGVVEPSLAAIMNPADGEIGHLHWVDPADVPAHVTELSARRIAAILADSTPRATENGFSL